MPNLTQSRKGTKGLRFFLAALGELCLCNISLTITVSRVSKKIIHEVESATQPVISTRRGHRAGNWQKSLEPLNNAGGDGRKSYLSVKAARLLARQVAFKGRLQGFLAYGLEMTD
jgi:hypothetical protein